MRIPPRTPDGPDSYTSRRDASFQTSNPFFIDQDPQQGRSLQFSWYERAKAGGFGHDAMPAPAIELTGQPIGAGLAIISPQCLLEVSSPFVLAMHHSGTMKWSIEFLLHALALSCAALLPRLLCGGEPDSVALAESVAQSVDSGVESTSFHTGSARFDGEWAFGTYLMATLGLGQTVLAHPEQKSRLLPAMQQSARRLVSDETNAFGSAAWGARGLSELAHGSGHAYLGYANLALSMLRLVDVETPEAALHDALTEALASRLAAAPHAVFETYPGETYPPDIAMVAGSIALHDCALGLPERKTMPEWRRAFSRYIDADSGLLQQVVDARSGERLGPARGSATGIAAYALSFVDPALSQRLYDGLRRQSLNVLGFGMIREYAAGQPGSGDIDSGPVLFGVGVSATGFALAGARLHGDSRLEGELYRTVNLFGVPLIDAHGSHFMAGGPLGNAILLAMTSASFEWSRHCRKAAS